MCRKTYYLETNALYSLSNYFDKIIEADIEVATSMFALQEIVDGVDETSFQKRKVLLSKIKSSNLKICSYLPKECVATAFYLDISNLPKILNERENLVRKIDLIIMADNYLDYRNNLLNTAGVDSCKLKMDADKLEDENKSKISAIIDTERRRIDELRKEQKKNPKYVEVNASEVFGNASDDKKVNKQIIKKNYEILLRDLLDSLCIQYNDADICKKIESRDRNALVAMQLGIEMYCIEKFIRVDGKQADRNDLYDLMHLLYLRDENHIIVSDDRIYSFCTLKSMRMGIKEFKNIVNCK